MDGGADLRPSLTFDLRPLRPDEALELAAATPAVPQDHVVRCVARAAGNPLFLEQPDGRRAARSGRAGVGPEPRPGQAGPAGAGRQAGPAGRCRVRPAVRAKRSDLPGRSADRSARSAASPTAGAPARSGRILFAHALVRDATYDTLLKSRRQAWHKRAAAWFSQHRQPILAAEHLERAQDPAAPNAYLRAARSQADEYRYGQPSSSPSAAWPWPERWRIAFP